MNYPEIKPGKLDQDAEIHVYDRKDGRLLCTLDCIMAGCSVRQGNGSVTLAFKTAEIQTDVEITIASGSVILADARPERAISV